MKLKDLWLDLEFTLTVRMPTPNVKLKAEYCRVFSAD